MKPAWMNFAACSRLPKEWWFPASTREDHESRAMYRKAIPVCEACSVKTACLEFAIRYNEPAGMWGGQTSMQRRSWRRKWLAERRAANK